MCLCFLNRSLCCKITHLCNREHLKQSLWENLLTYSMSCWRCNLRWEHYHLTSAVTSSKTQVFQFLTQTWIPTEKHNILQISGGVKSCLISWRKGNLDIWAPSPHKTLFSPRKALQDIRQFCKSSTDINILLWMISLSNVTSQKF